jgi:hypothetical protein
MGVKNKTKYQGVFTIGQTYGKYKVINSDIIIENEAKVLCRCQCGNERKVSCYTLIKGTSKQCSECGNSLKKDKNPAWKGYGDVSGKTISKIKRDAESRYISFNLTIEFLDSLLKQQEFKCALTGLVLSTNYKNLTASVDRIDSTKGYIENNVQWVHKDVNMMKNHYYETYFKEICKLVTNHTLQK